MSTPTTKRQRKHSETCNYEGCNDPVSEKYAYTCNEHWICGDSIRIPISHVPIKYRIVATSHYNRSVMTCPECWISMETYVGIAEDSLGDAVVVLECSKCFEKWHYHITQGSLKTYIATFDRLRRAQKEDHDL